MKHLFDVKICHVIRSVLNFNQRYNKILRCLNIFGPIIIVIFYERIEQKKRMSIGHPFSI